MNKSKQPRTNKEERLRLGKAFYEEQQRRKVDNSFVKWVKEQETGYRSIYLYIKEYMQAEGITEKTEDTTGKRRITLYIDRDLYKQVGFYSIEHDLSISGAIEELLRNALKVLQPRNITDRTDGIN